MQEIVQTLARMICRSRSASTLAGTRHLSAMVMLALSVAFFARPGLAIGPVIRLSGNLGGIVADTEGRPQMGAAVILFNHQAKLVQRVLTDDRGTFGFGSLPPDSYSVRVTLNRFLPAFRDHIYIQPGTDRFLGVSLSSLFSSIQLMPVSSIPAALMSDDWKWALRTSSASRPVTRILPIGPSLRVQRASTLFHETRGLVNISGGDSGSGARGETDLGTMFALETTMAGSSHLQLAGNVGYARASGLPSAAFRTSFSRDFGAFSPEVTITMRQIYLPGHAAVAGGPESDSLPPLRTLSASVHEKLQLADALTAEYGFEWDGVSLVDRLHYFSPYARMTLALPRGQIDMTYTSGNARPELGMSGVGENDALFRDLHALAMVPRVSMQAGRFQIQRGENYELGMTQPLGKNREVRISAYRESVSNAALSISGDHLSSFGGDVIPDFFSSAVVFNAGNFHTQGYTASVKQHLGENYDLTLMYGSVGVLTARSSLLSEASADQLRQLIEAQRRNALTVQTNGTIRHSGTHYAASYQWLDSKAATSAQLYSTESVRPEPGLDLLIRQPMPAFISLPGHMQLTAEVRNLLAQGYLPIALPDGRRLLLVNTPRSFRGGVSFSF
jgi:hypothetical protein